MRAREIKPGHQADRVWTLILDAGDDPVTCIESFASEHDVSAAAITAMEIIVTQTPAHLHKRHDPESGLALISTA